MKINLTNFLMTNNVVLNSIIISISCFLEAFISLKLFTIIQKSKYTNRQKLLYTITTGIVGTLANLFLENPYIYIVNILYFMVSTYFIFKPNIKNIFISFILIYILEFTISFILQLMLNYLFGINYTDILNIFLYKIIYLISNYLLLYIMAFLIQHTHTTNKKHIPPLKFTIIINLILGIIAIFIQSYIFSIYKNLFPNNLKLIALFSQILYFSISIYSLYRTNRLEQTTKDLETEKLYNKTLTLLHDNIRCFKHDFNNIVQSIGGYLALNDINGLTEYYSHMLADCQQINNLNLLNPQTINNPSIYSLLNNKYYLALEFGITVKFNIFSDLSKINCNIYQFTRILGILLDNAIEAARETEEKSIKIEFKFDSKKHIFIIENSCKDNNISTTSIFEKGYSTKENNSGIGLWEVHSILSKNTNIDLYTSVKNNKFTQELYVFFK